MKAVMLSIQPKWCELIAIGKKTIEVRKTKPKLETPFKCYIYCTKARKRFFHGGIGEAEDELYRLPNGKIKFGYSGELMLYDDYDENNFLNGKVIGEFVCDRVTKIKSEAIYSKVFGGFDVRYNIRLSETCLTTNEILQYIGEGEKGFAWHLSNLVIYDNPKELSEFLHKKTKEHFTTEFNIEGVTHYPVKKKIVEPISRPPQSWCYCEELANG